MINVIYYADSLLLDHSIGFGFADVVEEGTEEENAKDQGTVMMTEQGEEDVFLTMADQASLIKDQELDGTVPALMTRTDPPVPSINVTEPAVSAANQIAAGAQVLTTTATLEAMLKPEVKATVRPEATSAHSLRRTLRYRLRTCRLDQETTASRMPYFTNSRKSVR